MNVEYEIEGMKVNYIVWSMKGGIESEEIFNWKLR